MEFNFCPICKNDLSLDELNYQSCSGENCNFKNYQNPTPVVGAIVEYGKEQVVLAHNKLWPAQWYGLITGFVEKNESPDECVIREVKEEIGLDGCIESFVGHYIFKKMNQLLIIYHVIATGDIILDDEIDDVKLVPFDKVNTWPSGTGEGLHKFLEGKGFSPTMIDFRTGKEIIT